MILRLKRLHPGFAELFCEQALKGLTQILITPDSVIRPRLGRDKNLINGFFHRVSIFKACNNI